MSDIEKSRTGLKIETNEKKVKLNWKEILRGTTKIITNVSIKNYASLPNTFIDTLFDSFSFENTPGGLAWKLICTALSKSLIRLLFEKGYVFEEIDNMSQKLEKLLEEMPEENDYYLPFDFFLHPEAVFKDFSPVMEDYLGWCGLQNNEIKNLLDSNRSKTLFVRELRIEWYNKPALYKILKEVISSPFEEVYKKIREREDYCGKLRAQIETPVFGDIFCLEDIYIPLRACYKERKDRNGKFVSTKKYELQKGNNNEKEVIVELESELLDWIKTGKKNDGIRYIHGGPGSGKSSFLKMFAAKLARKEQNVFYIPLSGFKLDGELSDSINKYFRDTWFSFNLISAEEKDKKIIILFDGLDEIFSPKETLEKIANDFIWNINHDLKKLNSDNLRVQIIITGRDAVIKHIEKEHNNSGKALRLLPYLIQESKEHFIDEQNLFGIDQRQEWWRKYSTLKKKTYNGLPPKIQDEQLIEISAQPLLNYLIALVLDHKNEKRSQVDFSNLNTIYSELLRRIYEREYSEINHPIKDELGYDNFEKILKTIALCMWHGNGNIATVAEIEKKISDDIKKSLNVFTSEENKGAISLFTIFYFRIKGEIDAFEFTHKSFYEYLLALQIVDVVAKIHKELYKHEIDTKDGWDINRCLLEWLTIFGLQTPDEYLVRYIENEVKFIRRDNKGILLGWQSTIKKLWEQVLKEGVPVELLEPRPITFREENEQAIKAEKTLLILHGLIARQTNNVSKIKWPNNTSFRNFVTHITEQRDIYTQDFIFNFCNHLDLKNAIIRYKDLFRICLRECILESANLKGTNFRIATLEYTNLKYAILSGADLSGATLRYANLLGANLSGANLSGANLSGANLSGADLSRADLSRADLSSADLSRANLSSADLSEANLSSADLSEANLSSADLSETLFIYEAKNLFKSKKLDRAKLPTGFILPEAYYGNQ